MKACFKILPVFLLFYGCAETHKPDFSPRQAHLKIVTYNVNWGFVNPDKVARYLATENADIVCLQETHRYWKESLSAKLSRQYPYGKFREWGKAGGIAIISKYELHDANLIEPNDNWFPAFFARVDTPVGKIQILNVHLRPPLSDEGKVSVGAYLKAGDTHSMELDWFLRRTDPNQPMIILGDFNGSEKDKAIRRLIEEGWTDALSRYDRKTNTWEWRTSAGLEMKNRYDHILYNRFLDCTGAKVTDAEGSDHLPVTAVIVQKQLTK
ncbi:MAG: endonuclease/exonuclease/phosphatase family protein [Sedimentisphaerales bacterium]